MQQRVVQEPCIWAQAHSQRFILQEITEDPNVPSSESVTPLLLSSLNEFQKVFPILNLDKKFYTPTFILQ